MTGGGVTSSPKSCTFNRPSDASEADRDPVGRFDEVNVFLRGAGTGVRGFADSSRDPTFVDDVTVEVVSEYDQPSTFLKNVEALSRPFDGISG